MDLPEGKVLEYKSVAACKEKLTNKKIYIRIHELNEHLNLYQCRKNNLEFFYSKPAKTFYELNALKELGVSYVYVDAPLFFQMDKVKEVGIPLRIVPNRCYMPNEVIHTNGLHGTWIRPEKLDIYEPYASIVEFCSNNPKEEEAFYRIYIEKKEWPDDMGSIFYGFKMHMDNRLIYEGLDEMRLNCRQTCQLPHSTCHICDRVKHFESKSREWAEQYIKKTEDKKNET